MSDIETPKETFQAYQFDPYLGSTVEPRRYAVSNSSLTAEISLAIFKATKDAIHALSCA